MAATAGTAGTADDASDPSNDSGGRTPPRLFGIVAAAAPVAAVIRRGPTRWCQLIRWDLANNVVEPGAWLGGRIFPQKCDLSPDGRWFAASIHQPSARWDAGDVYESISRLPWLHSLAAWGVGSTYTRGIHFAGEPGRDDLGPPDVGDATPAVAAFGLAWNPSEQFVVERRRGWVEAPGTPPREAGGPWDESRKVGMIKASPAGGRWHLRVEGGYAAFRTSPDWFSPASYALEADDDVVLLDDVQWADWDATGRLLVATTTGHLQVRDAERPDALPAFDEDVSSRTPEPEPAPAWALQW